MAGTVQADFLQPQSTYGLTIQTPSGNTIATINSAGIFSNTGQQLLSYTGNVTGNIVSTGTITGNLVANSVSIGTTSTSYPLYIQQNASSNTQPMVALNPTTGTNAAYLYFNNSGSGGLQIGRSDSNGNGSGTTITAYDSFVATTGTTGLSFHTNNTRAAYLDSGQTMYVGSGTTSAGASGVIYSKTTARVWCNYIGTTQTIGGSFNISSVTYNATGDYTFNLTNAAPNSNGAAFACKNNQLSNASNAQGINWVNASTIGLVNYENGSKTNTQVYVFGYA